MSADLHLSGMDEILERIQSLGTVGNKTRDKALILAAQPILLDATHSTVWKDRSGKGREGLKVSRPKSKGDTRFVLIGIDEADISEIFYMKFFEFGSSKMPARPFLAPAYYRHRLEAFQIIKNELRRELGLWMT